MVRGPSLPPELLAVAERAEAMARDAGLSFFEVVFEMLDARAVNAVAAYGGFPVRYASWRFGMDFERLSRGHEWGLSKIYELVINHDPTIAYLVRSNSAMEQKLVMAHVFGHADFFKNNVWFSPTRRGMVQRFDDHARRVQRHMDEHGQDAVEEFLDAALSLDSLMDPSGPLKRLRRDEASRLGAHGDGEGDLFALRSKCLSDQSRERLLDLCGETGAALAGEAQAEKAKAELATAVAEAPFDILTLICDYGTMPSWKRELLRIVAAEAEYFLPQRMTKIINEGWASFWHSRLLTQGLLDASEIVEFADCHSGATAAAPGQLNPYKLGIELFRHAEESGQDLFRLRAIHNDVSFIDAVVDPEFVTQNKLFVMESKDRGAPKIGTRDPEAIKAKLLSQLAWGGNPRIRVTAAERGGPLALLHEHDGRDLKLDDAGTMLRTIGSVWGGPVTLETREGKEGRRLRWDGAELSLREAS